MLCEFKLESDRLVCVYCGRKTAAVATPVRAQCKSQIVRSDIVVQVDHPKEEGPGTELKELLSSLDITKLENCDCNAKMRQMNIWSAAGCREHFDEIVGWLREGAKQFGWADRLGAAAKAVATGLAFKINWADPFPGLVELAIQRAEKAAGKEQ